MSIESLVGRIIEDARKASLEIQRRALDEVKACEELAEGDERGIIDAAKERAIRSAGEQKQRLISMAELEDRKEVLKTKQQLIQEVFNQAVERILCLDTEAYGAFLKKLILQADPEGDEEILFNQRDRDRFGDGWTKRLNQSLVENKKKGKMRVANEIRPIQGGAILKRGRKEINCSLESIIGSKRDQLETRVAEILFRDSE